MPFFDVPEPKTTEVTPVENYRETNQKLGTMEDLENLAKNLHQNGMNVIMDFCAIIVRYSSMGNKS